MDQRQIRSATPGAALALLAATLLMVACGGSASQSGAVPPASARLRLAVPAYFTPDPRLDGAAGRRPVRRSGRTQPGLRPRQRPDAAYQAAVQEAHAAAVTVLGYVGTDRGRRPLDSVLAEVAVYAAWYATDGIFFDEASTDCGLAAGYYAPLYAAVKAGTGRRVVALNPGGATEECYMRVADVVATFEDSYSAYTAAPAAPSWTSKYAPTRFWHLVYAAPSEAELLEAVRLARQRRAGWLYVTPGTLPNPWEALPPPPYWSRERAVAALSSPSLSPQSHRKESSGQRGNGG